MIAVDSLSKSFITDRGKVEVLREVSLNISAGARIAIVGASGAGKTTLMHLLGGLDKPTSGSVTFAGRDIFSYSAAELDAFRNRSIGFVFQFHQLLPEFTALENVGRAWFFPLHIDQRRGKSAFQFHLVQMALVLTVFDGHIIRIKTIEIISA